MEHLVAGWSTEQLTELLVSVSAEGDAEGVMATVIDHAAAATEAEIAAVIVGDRVEASIGFPAGQVPERELVEAATQRLGTLAVAGLGECHVASVPVDGPNPGWLLVARAGADPKSRDEQHLLRGMGKVLAMSLQSVRRLESLNERQALLERLSRLQRSIAGRTDHQQVLDAIVDGAAELVGDEVVSMRLINSDDPGRLDMVASAGLSDELKAATRSGPIGAGASGRSMQEGRLLVVEDYSTSPDAVPEYVADGLHTAMATPIVERGEIVGSLVVGTRREGRRYSESEREALTLFAENAGLALNDARAAAETVHQALHDSLTGLPNRALFHERLEAALDRAERTRGEVAVLFGDIDGFKAVNDRLGHPAGDELLMMAAERLTGVLRAGDTAARFGGDEFAILVEDVSDRNAPLQVAERALKALADPFLVRGHRISITASVGIATGRGPADHMLRNADLAMYRAKTNGKGRVEHFEPGMHATVLERLALESDLEKALERDEFILHYQPIVALESGRITGVEALVRWNHPTRGLVGPIEFIPLAEESGQIIRLGKRVLREACSQAALWQARYERAGEPLEMRINLSGVQLGQRDLASDVDEAIERSGVAASSVIFEITETGLMSETGANATLDALKAIGIRLAVDDFGTGYSSLEYLRRYPIDNLKIAKSFVDELRTTDEAGALVQAIVDLAHGFGLEVVAEGIEHSVQRERLIELGCSHGQGFLFAAPAPASEVESVLMHAAIGSVALGAPRAQSETKRPES